MAVRQRAAETHATKLRQFTTEHRPVLKSKYVVFLALKATQLPKKRQFQVIVTDFN